MEILPADTLEFRPHAAGESAAACAGQQLGITTDHKRSEPQFMPTLRRIASVHSVRFLMFGLVALALAGCSKCDMPVWRHEGAAPQSCHDEAPPQ